MDQQSRNSALAAFFILVGFGIAAYFMPTLMLAAMEISPIAAVVLGGVFLMAFFLIFWLRGRSQSRKTLD